MCVTVDCLEPELVARFWNEALRWGGVAVATGGNGAECGPIDDSMYLEFARVPDAKAVKNRRDVGMSAGTLLEPDREIERLTGLGPSIAREEEFPEHIAVSRRNVVSQDPERNEFCLSGGTHPG
ncbi:MAG: VOC family protein [Microthrixaceae bacterium]